MVLNIHMDLDAMQQQAHDHMQSLSLEQQVELLGKLLYVPIKALYPDVFQFREALWGPKRAQDFCDHYITWMRADESQKIGRAHV